MASNTTAQQDRAIGNAESAVSELIDIINDLDSRLDEKEKELTEKNDIITELKERIEELENEAAEIITASLSNE